MLGHAPLSAQPIATSGSGAVDGSATFTASASLAVRPSARIAGGAILRASAALGIMGGAVRAGRAGLTARASVSAEAIRVRQAVTLSLGSGELRVTAGAVMRATASARGWAGLDVVPASAFEDLIANPNRRLVYTIEMDPWLLRPYEDAA